LATQSENRQPCSSVNFPDASIPKRGEADGSRRPSRLPFFFSSPSGVIKASIRRRISDQRLVLVAVQFGMEGRGLEKSLPKGARGSASATRL